MWSEGSMTLFGYRLPALSSLILWALLWEAVGRAELTFFIPPFSDVMITLVGLLPTPAFLNALGVTASAFCAGVFFAIVIGIPVGILMGKSRILDEMLLPWVNIFLSAPLTALVPVLMVLFGFGTRTVIITTTLFAIWIIILNARAGVRQINRSLVEMARSFGASPWDAFVKVYFWAALPEILGGVRIGVLRAVKGVIIGQLLISIVGFGALFELYSSKFLMAEFWAVLIVLFGLAFALSEFLAYLERKVSYYAASR
jgi:NitT/TauT family transport system permease protein